jgi:hypothetical protein
MDRRDFFIKQKVTEGELDDAFLQVEVAEQNIKKDGFGPAARGFLLDAISVVEDSPVSTSVSVPTFLAWSKDGERIEKTTAAELFSFAGDDDPVNPTIASLYAVFDRALSDPRVDGLGATVNHKVDESYDLERDLGTPAGSPVPPAIRTDGSILLANVTIPAAAGTISNSEIDNTVQELNSDFPIKRLASMTPGMDDAMVAAAGAAPSTANRVALLSDAAGFADGYISNVKIVTTGVMPTDTIDVERATAVNGGATPDILMNVKNAPLDLGAAPGPGGLDVGAVANATYYIYLIGDSLGVGADDVCASLDAGPGFGGAGPNLAINFPNHDRFRLIGCITRVAGEIMPFRQIDNMVVYDDTIKTAVFGPGADPHVGGGPGVGSGFILLSLAPYVPAIAERAYLRATVVNPNATVPQYNFRSRGGITFTPATDYTNAILSGESAALGVHHHSESHFPIHVDVSLDVDWERQETAVAATVGVFVTGYMVDLHHD